MIIIHWPSYEIGEIETLHILINNLKTARKTKTTINIDDLLADCEDLMQRAIRIYHEPRGIISDRYSLYVENPVIKGVEE